MDYWIAEANDATDLMAKVKEAIKDGWVPCGGVSVSVWPGEHIDDFVVMQAMVRHQPIEIEPHD